MNIHSRHAGCCYVCHSPKLVSMQCEIPVSSKYLQAGHEEVSIVLAKLRIFCRSKAAKNYTLEFNHSIGKLF